MTEVIFNERKRLIGLNQGDKVDSKTRPSTKLTHGPDIDSSAFITEGKNEVEIKPGEIKHVEIDGQLVEVTHKPLTRFSI